MDDVVEIFVLLLTSFFSLLVVRCLYLCVGQIVCVFMVTRVNICNVIFLTAGLIYFLNCVVLNYNLNINGR